MVFISRSLAVGKLRVHRARLPARGRNSIDDKLPKVKSSNGMTYSLSDHVIRFTKDGCTNRPFYRIVLNKRFDHNQEKEIEQLGTFDPMPNLFNEKLCGLNYSRIKYHMGMGAHPTRPVRRLLGLAGFLPQDPSTLILAKNLRRRVTIEELLKEEELEEKNEKTETATT